jgi:hypothetical protein
MRGKTMTDDNEQRSELLRMEEYKALRAEGLRSAGIIANTVWLGTAQFALTIGVAATCVQKGVLTPDILLLMFLVVLSIESAAGTFMFLSELRKYVRVGSYIRENIEKVYPVMGWESWIQSKRSIGFPIFSIIILQFPFLASVVYLLGWPLHIDFLINNHLSHDFQSLLVAINWQSLLVVLITADLAAILLMLWQIRQEGQHGRNHD